MKISLTKLEDIKAQVVDFVVNEMVMNREITEEAKERKRSELLETINSRRLVTQSRTQSGITNSSDFNLTNQEMYLDLLNVFKYVNELEKSIGKHSELNLSATRTISNLASDLEDQIESLERTLSNRNLTYFHVENFARSNSSSADNVDFTERYGETVGLESHALVNTQECVLTLPYLRRHNMMTHHNSVVTGEVKLRKQACSAFSYGQSRTKDLTRLIDTSLHTYWSDTLFVDEPIELQFEKTPSDGLENFYYGVREGALFELEFHFESVVRINELNLTPYIKYPLELVAIRYSTSDNLSDSMIELLSPQIENERFQSQTLDGSWSIRFPDINCKHLFFIFNQTHYVKESFLLNNLDLFKNHLWNQLHQRNFQHNTISPSLIFKPIYSEKEREYPEIKYLNELKSKNQKIDIRKFLTSGQDYAKLMTKYQYQYGFYNISPSFVEFQETGIFVTKTIQVEGNIKAIKLETDQFLDGLNGRCLSDAEYYVSCSLDQFQEWQSLLPKNISVIECERLQVGMKHCELRFPATQIFNVYYEDEQLIEGVDYELVKEESLIVGLDIPGFKNDGMYTVSYQPISSSQELNLVQQDNPMLFNKLESIPGTNRSYYELEEYPYLTEDKITNLKLINKENGMILSEENHDLDCVTNLLDSGNSFKNFNHSSSRFQYYTHKNHLYFNHPIPSNYDIEINYQHFISSFQIKVILRRNTSNEGWISPAVSQLKAEILMLD